MNEAEIRSLYRDITLRLIERGLTITTMESCTAGLVASLITDTEGSSAVMKGAFITYSNEAKVARGVPAETIARYGVYSPETAREMARVCRREYAADIGVGVTGTLGNVDPANRDSVPGAVYIAIDTAGGTRDWQLRIPPLPSRFDGKLAVAGEVARRLRELLKG